MARLKESQPAKKILILAANPKTTSRLRLDEEVREIEEGLRRSKYRDRFQIKAKWAVTFGDIRRAMLDYEPDIVHFCGHGEKDGLIVEDKSGKAIWLTPDAFVGLFKLFEKKVECVLLNACYSEPHAKIIRQHINFVYGNDKAIKHDIAVEFAVGFYDALGAGKNYEEAYKFGQNAIQFGNSFRKNTVFICHSHKDKLFHAEPLAKDLKKHGIEVWYDSWSILPGDSLIQKISSGIRESDCFIVLLTPNSIDSNWVNFELGQAFDRRKQEGIRIIPIIWGECNVPDFLKSFNYLDFRKGYSSGLKELLLVFGIESQVLSESEKTKLILKMFTPEQQADITEFALSRGYTNKQAFKKITKKKLHYLILGLLGIGLGLFGNLFQLLAKFGDLVRFGVPLGMVFFGLQLSTKYLGPKFYVKRYYKLLSIYEDLSTDYGADLHRNNSVDLFYEFLNEKDKRFYRKYRIKDKDIDNSLNICKRWYAILGGVDLLALIGLLIYSESLEKETDIMIFFKLVVLLLGGILFTEYNNKIKKINEMYKSKEDFERTIKIFTCQNPQDENKNVSILNNNDEQSKR